MTAAALYIHVPFCPSKCAYCDFSSSAGSTEAVRAEYVETLRRHIEHWSEQGVFDGGAPSVYVGGGTPTLLGEALVDLVAWVRRAIEVAPGAEVTVESNPETTDPAGVERLVAAGVNRFSLGVQSFDDATLRYLGRCHDADSAELACATLRESGVAFSIDLICGVPGLSASKWRTTLERAIATGADHMSVYPLTVEAGTPLAERVDAGQPDPDADAAAADMLLASEVLHAAGIRRYEVANYARPGHESRHNTGYWTGVPYVGVGPSAAGMLPADGGRLRFSYPSDMGEWLSVDHGDLETEVLDSHAAAREDVMLGLRLSAGVSAEQVRRAMADAVLENLAADGLVEWTGRCWRTTERGWLLGNEVFSRVLFD